MRLRYALIEAILKVKTRDAVQAALDHPRDLLRLCRSDNLGVRDCVPALYLRLGQDQEAYDFCKWYVTEGSRSDYDWGDMDMPFLSVKNADVFEDVDEFDGKYPELGRTIPVILVKIRLLLDIEALHNSAAISDKVPRKVLDQVREALVTNIVSKEKNIMEAIDQTARIKDLESHIDTLYNTIDRTCPDFWPALLDPEPHLRARPSFYSPGSLEQAQILLQFNYESWAETPGAIDVIRGISKEKALANEEDDP